MNRRHLLVAATATASLALVGCSSSSSGSTSATSTTTATSTGSASTGTGDSFPVTVATKFGDVSIAKKPERVVALGWGDAEDALQLGVQPVGASDWLAFGGDGVGPWLKGAYTKSPELIGTMEPSYEKIAALKPDLILDVKGSGDKARHDRLAAIAPTVSVPKDGDAYLTPPDEQLTMIATALGESEKGKALAEQVSKKFSDAAAAHPGWKGKTSTAVTKTSQGWGAYAGGGDRLAFLKKLGFVQNPKIAAMKTNSTGFSVDLSAEKLDAIDADLVVGFPIFIKTEQMTSDPAFTAVPAVKKGHAVVIDGPVARAFSLGSPAAQGYAIDALVPMIEKAIGK